MNKQHLLDLMTFSKSLQVLYVEDNEEARISTLELLKMFFSNVVIAVDGQDGLKQYKNRSFDLIITDISMPNMNGLDMICEIRKEDDETSIVILTAFEESKYLLESIKYSVDSYLLKPIKTEQFVQTIAKVLHKIQLERENQKYKKNLHNIIEDQKEKIHKQEKFIYQQAKLASMGEMIDSIAHQWKQPLSAIYMHAQSSLINFDMTGEITVDELRECNVQIKNQIDHLIDTMDEFRNFFRPDVKKETILLKDIVLSVTTLIQNDLMQNNIKLESRCNCNIEVNIIPNEFKHILINIINNAKDAFKADQKNKTIIIEPIKDDKNYILQIKDNAGGIPDDVIDHIFKANFTTKQDKGGTGIGLYMSKMIIEKIDGTLSVANDSDGAVFQIKLPIVQ